MGARGVFLLAVAVTLFAAAPAIAAPVFVGTVDARSILDDRSNTLTLTVGDQGVAAGDTVVVVGSKGMDQESVASVSDSGDNTYRIDRQLHGPLYTGMSMTVASGAIVNPLRPGDTITLTYEGGTGYTNRFGGAYEFSGLAANAFDGAADAASYGMDVTTGAAPTSQAGDLVFGLFELQTAATTFDAQSGLNALPQIVGGAVNKILQPVWRIADAAGPQAASGATSSFVSWNGIAVAYRSANAPPTPPTNTTPPAITGMAQAGSTLTADRGTWTGDEPIVYAYRWQRCSGASCIDVRTGTTYVLASDDVGSTIQVVVTAIGAAGGSASVTSAPTPAVAAAPPPPGSPGFVQMVDHVSVTDDRSRQIVLTVPARGVAAGDTLIVVGSSGGAVSEPIESVVDSHGSTYTLDGVAHGGQAIGVFSASVPVALPAGTTITITFEGTVGYTNRFAAAYEFAGLNGLDHSATMSSYGSQLDTSAAAMATDGALLLGIFNVQSSAPSFTPGAGFMALAPTVGAAVNDTLLPEWRIAGSAGPYSASATLGGYASWTGVVVGYRRSSSAPPPAAPVNVSPPGILGTAQEGQRLNATRGTWNAGATASYRYQWQRCDASDTCKDLTGETATSYLAVHADVGSRLRVVVTAVDVGGTASAASSMVSVSPLPAPPANIALPAILGDPAHGSTLTAATGTWSGDPTAFAIQWRRCDTLGLHCTDAAQSSSGYPQTYSLVDTSYFPGATYRIAVTATSAAGSATALSAPTDAAFEPGAPGQPRFVRGVGSTSLVANTGNTITLTVPAGGVEAGDTVVVAAAKGADTGAIASISDSRGNAYTIDLNAATAAGSGFGLGIASAYVTTALLAGDTIVVTFAGAPSYSNRWAIGYAFAGLAPAAADVSATAGGYGTQLAVGPTPATSQASELVFSAYNVQEAVWSDPAGFTAARGFALAAVKGSKTLHAGFEVVSATGPQQAAARLGVNSSWAGAVVTYKAG